MPQVQEKKKKTRQETLHIPLLLRRAEDVNRTPAFGSGVLLPGQARRKPIETVCSLFDYGMDASLVPQWQEWELLAITSSMDNEYSEGSSRGRLLPFGVHFKPLIAVCCHVVCITKLSEITAKHHLHIPPQFVAF